MKKNHQKENRRSFIRDKLWKGILFAITGSLPTIARATADQEHLPTAIYTADGETIDWDKVKRMFTLAAKRHHFNTASISPSPKVVQDKTIETIHYLNRFGSEEHKRVEPVRLKLGQLLNAPPTQLAITRNTTEGMNIIARSLGLQKGDEVIITNQEHVGGAAPWLTLQNEIGIGVTVIDIAENEENTCSLLERAITPRTKAISVSHITCTTGAVLPVKDVIVLCKKHGVQSVIDGAQAVGQIPVDLGYLNPDFYAASGHKWLYGPNGTGILYLNKDFLMNTGPLFSGAYTDRIFDINAGLIDYVQSASRYEYGTLNAPIMAGLGAAVDFIQNIGTVRVTDRCKQLSTRFYMGIKGHKNITILTPEKEKLRAAIVTFRISDKQSAEVCRLLVKGGVTVLRHVHENNLNAIRASFAIFTSEEEVDELIARILLLAEANE
jgi:selenocysteine lyase/cysteine desulfurase